MIHSMTDDVIISSKTRNALQSARNGRRDRSLHGYCWQEEDYYYRRADHTTHFRGGREVDGCYSSKFLRSSARRFLFEILVRGTRYEVARDTLIH